MKIIVLNSYLNGGYAMYSVKKLDNEKWIVVRNIKVENAILWMLEFEYKDVANKISLSLYNAYAFGMDRQEDAFRNRIEKLFFPEETQGW